jgi:ComF family protein
VCRGCFRSIEYITYPFCVTCSIPLPDGGAHCWKCRRTRYHFEKIAAAGRYAGVLRNMILKFKEKETLRRPLGEVLLKAVRERIPVDDVEVIVPVPLSRKREFERGYNQSQLLAEHIGSSLGKRVVIKNLLRVKDTKPQFKLSKEERLENLKGAFSVAAPAAFKNKNIILVDDITTTCVTFEECSAVLRRAGSGRIYCATLARD